MRVWLVVLLFTAVIVTGSVTPDFCGWSTGQINAKSDEMLAILNRMVRRPFFRFFFANTKRECPFWAVSLLCTSADNPCGLCTCDPNEIPVALRTTRDMTELPHDNPVLTRRAPTSVGAWGTGFEVQPDEGHGGEYIDLVRNPEGNTGYAGPQAARIWQTIYQENCLQSGEGMCQQQEAFFKLISGIHVSVSTHVATAWSKKDNRNPENPPPPPQCAAMLNRITAFPDRIGNLHMVFQFALRAMTRAAATFSDRSVFSTGDSESDDALLADIDDLFKAKLLCSDTFNETQFLEAPGSRALVAAMRQKVQNITSLMDCVACEKCRLWGKLEFLGLATAFKIVLRPSDTSIPLARNEIVALVNLLRQLAVSVHKLADPVEACRDPHARDPEDL